MNSLICNYDLELFHPRKQSLVNIQKKMKEIDGVSCEIPPQKIDKGTGFILKALVSKEETGSYTFIDDIKKLLESNVLLDIGGSFIDNIGRGYINSLGYKDYTKTY